MLPCRPWPQKCEGIDRTPHEALSGLSTVPALDAVLRSLGEACWKARDY